jgi:hypothetical protein
MGIRANENPASSQSDGVHRGHRVSHLRRILIEPELSENCKSSAVAGSEAELVRAKSCFALRPCRPVPCLARVLSWNARLPVW